MCCMLESSAEGPLRLRPTQGQPMHGLIALQVYCLPDGYEVVERSLDDIRYHLNPTFATQEIARLDKVSMMSLLQFPATEQMGQREGPVLAPIAACTSANRMSPGRARWTAPSTCPAWWASMTCAPMTTPMSS
jgi:hypothetical protein